ncbi:MAG: hydroxymethylbilane synthase [Haloarculaceae archaeon]
MTQRGTTIRLATRGSALALRQASLVRDALEGRHYEVDLVEVETRGDQIRDELIHRLGTTGAFVRALDEQVLAGDVDAAVHSMKDMPTEMPEGLIVAGVPERARPEDVLVTPDGRSLADLPEGAVVGTSSLRRRAQVLAERPDLSVEPLRGNVDTRLEKLLAPHRQREHQRRVAAEESHEDPEETGYDRTVQEWFEDLSEIERGSLERDVDVEYDAIVLAAAGLERAGLLHQVEHVSLSPTEFLPSPGQGALAVTALDDEVGARVHDAVDHPRTRVETTVERTVLAELGGGCVAPIGAYAVLQGEFVHCVARVFSLDGTDVVGDQRDLPVQHHAEAAREFAADLADRGAADLVEDARTDAAEQEAARDG